MKYKILYVDDDRANLDTFQRAFRFDYDVMVAESGAAGLETVKKHPDIALIVADQRMPGMKGIEFLEKSMSINSHAQRLMLTAFTDVDALLGAIQKGHVYDYVVKPWDPDVLKGIMSKAISLYEDRMERIKQLMVARSENESLKAMVGVEYDVAHIVGADGGLKPVLDQVKKVAITDSTVLIRGESGTGKELIAHAVHGMSARSQGPLVKLNCAALSEGVLESELFGHEKGAFTGAVQEKKGRFEVAHGGTLFLDEIGDLPEAVQVKLLRVIQEREFERVGGTETKKVDVRLVTATHQPLEKLVEERKFREDLFYRINVVPLNVPPLRQRVGDIAQLVDHFLAKYNAETGKNLSISEEARKLLAAYEWPGNVRELANVIERAVILGEGELMPPDFTVDFHMINTQAARSTLEKTNEAVSVLESIHDENASKLADAIRKANGNISETARLLCIPRSTLVYRLKKYNIV